MSYRRRDDQKKIKIIAQERIEILLSRADKVYSIEPELALRYGDLARKIVMKQGLEYPINGVWDFVTIARSFFFQVFLPTLG